MCQLGSRREAYRACQSTRVADEQAVPGTGVVAGVGLPTFRSLTCSPDLARNARLPSPWPAPRELEGCAAGFGNLGGPARAARGPYQNKSTEAQKNTERSVPRRTATQRKLLCPSARL